MPLLHLHLKEKPLNGLDAPPGMPHNPTAPPQTIDHKEITGLPAQPVNVEPNPGPNPKSPHMNGVKDVVVVENENFVINPANGIVHGDATLSAVQDSKPNKTNGPEPVGKPTLPSTIDQSPRIEKIEQIEQKEEAKENLSSHSGIKPKLANTDVPRPGIGEIDQSEQKEEAKEDLSSHSGIKPKLANTDVPRPRIGEKGTRLTVTDVPAKTKSQGHRLTNVESSLDKKEETTTDNVRTASAEKTTFNLVTPAIGEILKAPDTIDGIRSQVSRIAEGIPVFMNALNEVAKIHPFIAVAVIAFKAVYTLEMTRHENDKKIIALFAEMKNMMGVLLQLQNLREEDVNKPGPGDKSMKDRLELLCEQTSKDIGECLNVCDAYSRRRLLVKVLNGPVWEQKLAFFVGIFTTRRSEFHFALSIYSATGISDANRTLADVEKTAAECNRRVELLLEAFKILVPADQAKVKEVLVEKGSLDELRGKDAELENYLKDKTLSPETGFYHTTERAANKTYDLDDLKGDLSDDLNPLLKRNREAFSRKFEMQKRQAEIELADAVRREGDRLVEAFKSGPQDRISDPDIHKLWTDMGWKGNVKARHFVLALRDYFLEQKETTKGIVAGKPIDEWALAYLDVKYLQPVLEAFDDDASGFVSVAEINKFTTSRPENWSLLHWIAYWAIGANITMRIHRDRIKAIFKEMFSLLPIVLPENRAAVGHYLMTVWRKVTTMTDALQHWKAPDLLQWKFKTYADKELERLKSNLETCRYDIDDLGTLSLITGPGRIEKTYFPLVRLLLERHLQIFHVARKEVLDEEELRDAADTMFWVEDAVGSRLGDLRTNFGHQAIDLKHRFKKFAFGMFEYRNDPALCWSSKIVKNKEYKDLPCNASSEPPPVDIKKVLNFGLPGPIKLDTSGYEYQDSQMAVSVNNASETLRLILGRWTCMVYVATTSERIGEALFTINLQARPSQGVTNEFEAQGAIYVNQTSHITGSCSTRNDGVIEVTWTIAYSGKFGKENWSGTYNPVSDTLSGTWSADGKKSSKEVGRFFFSRMPSEVLLCRPAPIFFEKNRIKALWRFACDAARRTVHQYSWAYIKKRRDTRRRYLELYFRKFHYGRDLDEAEDTERIKIKYDLTSGDTRFYVYLIKRLGRFAIHQDTICDSCSCHMGLDRIICLQCDSTADQFRPLSLCGDSRCLKATISTTKRKDLTEAHLPSHSMIKVRKLVILRNIGATYKAGLAADQRAKKALTTFEAQGELVGGGSKVNGVSSLPKDTSVQRHTRGPTCLKCHGQAQRPCLFCVDCSEPTFICLSCDRPGGFSSGAHSSLHSLVICHSESHNTQAVTMETRLNHLAEHVSSLHQRTTVTVETQLNDMSAQVSSLHQRTLSFDERMTKIESMLHAIALKVDSRLS